MTPPRTWRRACVVPLALLVAGCVPVDPKTGEYVPRGNQRYEYARVKERAERLQNGMSKYDALILLGSPAEKAMHGDQWIYLPERPGFVVPASALVLEFENGRLREFGYRAIVLGQRL